VYLPGIHGDWTLAGQFRRALGEQVRLVEIGYPLGEHWTERDYAEAIVRALAKRKIQSGWLLGESFGSQIAWEMCHLGTFQIHGIILAGGFVRHPFAVIAKLLYVTSGRCAVRAIRRALAVYGKVARLRFGRSPEVLAEIRQFIARRTEADLRSGRHRLALIAQYDPRQTAASVDFPVFALNGWLDPVVPYLPVNRWLKRNCRGFREHKLIWHADHNVLGTAPKEAATQVLEWILGRKSLASERRAFRRSTEYRGLHPL
jgi:pimeloyl-ACP methyl ester carboxylesterase